MQITTIKIISSITLGLKNKFEIEILKSISDLLLSYYYVHATIIFYFCISVGDRTMDYKKQIGKKIAAFLLLVALMLPVTVQFFHLFEEHEHITCTEKTSHVHESITKCEVCSFYLASFNYEIAKYSELLAPNIPEKVDVNFTHLQFHSFKITNTQLRAPPIFS